MKPGTRHKKTEKPRSHGPADGGHVTTAELAGMLKLSVQIIGRYVSEGMKPVGQGRPRRFDPAKCREWIAANKPLAKKGGRLPGAGRKRHTDRSKPDRRPQDRSVARDSAVQALTASERKKAASDETFAGIRTSLERLKLDEAELDLARKRGESIAKSDVEAAQMAALKGLNAAVEEMPGLLTADLQRVLTLGPEETKKVKDIAALHVAGLVKTLAEGWVLE